MEAHRSVDAWARPEVDARSSGAAVLPIPFHHFSFLKTKLAGVLDP